MNTMEVDTWSDDEDDEEAEIAQWRRSQQSSQTRLSSCFVVLFVVFVVAFVVSLVVGRTEDSATKLSSPSSDTRGIPTNPPSSSMTVSPQATVACLDLYQCQSQHPDRFGHDTPLLIGHALCNEHLRFGLTPSGVFQWHDCDTLKTKVMYDPSVDVPTTIATTATDRTVSYFSMSSTGAFQLFNSLDVIVWKKETNVTITFSKDCLPNPLLDCPYLYV